MVSKNNKNFYLRKSAKKVSKYAIKKLSVGVASVLLSTAFFLGSASVVNASADGAEATTELVSGTADKDTSSESHAVSTAGDKETAVTEAPAVSEAVSEAPTAVVSEAATETSSEAAVSEAAVSEAPVSEASVTEKTEVAPTSVASEVSSEAQAPISVATKEETANSEASAAPANEVSSTSVASAESSAAKESDAAQVASEAPSSIASETTANNETQTTAAAFRSVSTRAADTATDETTVNSWSQLVSAMSNAKYKTINVNGALTATSNNNIGSSGHAVTVKGIGNAALNIDSNYLVANGSGWNITFENLNISTGSGIGVIKMGDGSNQVTFKDVTHSGNSLFGSGKGTEVIIDGTTTSTVNTAPFHKEYGNGAKQYAVTIIEKGAKAGQVQESGAANIHDAKAVTIKAGANFTLNRSSVGDGINLPDGSTVSVGDKATFTVNMNTNNDTSESARYHNAGIFMLNGGSFITGRQANVTFNTSIGQAISIGADRPGIAIKDKDRFGGYTAAQARNAGPSTVQLGEYSTFNFNGRDGIILGDASNFISGEYSTVHFKNKGNGVALDLANNSKITISKHSNTLFESAGKGDGEDKTNPASGSYNAYNYIGVNENGNILIDEYATFRVIMTGRGSNPWDDVISLDSRKAGSSASFISKKGAIIDIRDDNTDFYGELISFPLSSNSTITLIDIQDPLYVNLHRYSTGGSTTGWMPVGGDSIDKTSTYWTANLIYMGGTNSTLKIGGSNYVVYQEIKNATANRNPKTVKSAQQIWLNVDSITMNMDGFANVDTKNNGANPDVSISGRDLVAGVLANNIDDRGTVSPLVNPNAPHFGISTMRADHQIWFPHGTVNQVAGTHKNTVKFVYDNVNGTQAAPTVTQEVNMVRDLTLDITSDKIKDIQSYASSHTADETLKYITDSYAVTKDSGWKVEQGFNTKTAYDDVAIPEIAGYQAEIVQTNANGVKAGDTSVHASLDIPADVVVKDGQLTDAYKNNGTTGIPADYETIVVYKKISTQVLTYTVIDDTTKTTLVDAAKLAEGDSSSEVPASVAASYQAIQKNYTDKGYVIQSADSLPTNFDSDDAVNQNVTIHLVHATVPVTPQNPQTPGTPINPNDPDGPKWPAGTDKDSLQKAVKETVRYVGADALTPTEVVQSATYTKSVTVDKVTGEIVSQTDWTPDKKTYDEVKTPVVPGYYADKATVPGKDVVPNDIVETVTYKPLGHIVPVDPEGNPIPDADTPIYENNPNDPTKVIPGQKVPEIPGYTPEVPTVTPNDPGTDTKVIYVKIVDQVAKVTYIDDTAKKTLETADLTGLAGTTSNYRTIDTINKYLAKGYTLVSNNYPATGVVFDDDKETVQSFEVHLEHATVPVTPQDPQTPGTPINPNDPDGPKWPTGTDKDSLQKVVKETVHYVGAGDKTPADNVQNATYTKSVTVDKVTGEIVSQTEWTPDKKNYDEVKTPVIPGYYADKATVPSTAVVQNDIEETVTYKELGHIVPVDPDGNPIPGADTPIYNNDPNDPTKVVPNQPVPEIPGYTPQVPTITPDDPGADTKVVYVKDADQVAKVTYIDDTTNKTLETTDLTGQAGATSDYRTNDTIAKYLAQGYELVSNNYPANGVVFDNDNNTVQSFEVHLKHAVAPVGPNDPHEPGTPINPNDPDGPKWPAKDQYTKQYTSTVHFVDEAGNKVFDDNAQTSTWTRTLLVDKVTGEVQNPDEPWTADKAQYDAVTVPVKEDYYADKNRVVAKDTVQKDLEETVVYKPLGHIVPVDKDGKEIPKAPTPEYNNDQNDPTKGTTTPVPDIPGYHPEVPSVTPTDPGKDTPVVYVKDEDPVKPDPTENDQKATIIYRDITTDTVLDSVSVTGKSETAINYSTAAKIKELTDKGYVLVNDGFPSDATFDNNDNVDQTYYVTLKHGEAPVGPNNPHEPGTPINPNDPNGPKWPAKDEYSKQYTATVHFVDENGNHVFDDDVQTSTWTRTLLIDTVTGEIKNPLESWKADKDKYGDVLAPILPKYYADKNRVVGKVTEQNNLEDTIVYKPLGHIVPVDEDGKEIPKAPTPQYNNDPTDPTKGGSTPVPDIPGYHPEIPSVTPTNPGEDTPVKYIKDKDPEKPTTPSENDQKATVLYRDLTTDTILDSASLTGKPNAAIEYSTAAKIKEFTDKGYVLVNDGFPSDATFDNNDNVDQVYYVTLKHGEEPVGPNNPHEPGTPINPNDPDGPKWPAKDEYSKQYSATVHFVDENGNQVFDDDVQTSTWTRTLFIDTVTGEVKNPQETWKADKDKYSAVVAPVKEDYYADKASVAAKDVVQDNLEDTIIYKPLGHIVPVDPAGNPIPNAPTPEYNNDPKDPTKGGETPVPNIPGYHPEIPSVTPDKPGEDTPVKYIKDAVNYSLTEKFVDEAGNELSPTVVKGTEFKQGDSYDVSGDAKVIKGYYLKAVSDNAKGTFGEADVTVTFTYAKLGNIVPVDPSGTPIPDAPTPPYKNDPNDPTKGGETPVPVIPGYTPEIPSVTPDKPGEDTPVVYVPVTPEKDAQAVRIIYRDITNDMVLDSVDLSGKAGEKVAYSTAAKIKELTDKGYVLVNDGFPSDAVFDDDANVDQTYYVTLKHGEEPVGPNNPHEPGTPINPNDPDGPKWPNTDEYTKKYTSTVQFVDDKGNKLRDDDVQTSTWTRTLLIDTVTGEIKNPTEPWTSDIAKYADVTAPVIEDYYADKSRVTGKTAVEENLVEKIVYKPLGHIVPVDPSGNPIPGADTPQFNNDPNDPTKGGTTPVPDIPDYTPRVPSITPENPGKDVPVIYDKKGDPNKPDIPNDHKQLAKVIYRDITTDTDLITDKFTGEAGAKLDYSTAAKIKELTDKGYVLVSDGFPSDAVFDDDANVDQTYYVTFKHGEEPVGPNNPHEPGTPINPNDPDGPKWPAKDEYSKEYTSTVHFVDKDGNKLRDDDVQTSTWTRTLIVDTVTGKVKNPAEPWKADKASYDEVAAPVITGYYADKDKIAGLETVQDNLENSITYSKLGNIVPVDPAGNPIPNAPTPSYNNDPKDPTKGGETPVPNIPGYHPEIPSVTPDKPGEDTPVKYVKDEVNYSLTENFVDEAGNKLAEPVVKGSDYKEGTAYDVTGDAKVITGYYLKEVPANAKGTVGTANITVTFVYAKLGNIVPVDPAGNPIPNAPTPSYNNDPKDPTKGGETPVPNIPGYTPQVPNVTPDKPGEDTPVVYVPVTPEKQTQTAKIIYLDDVTGKTITTDIVTGKSGDKIDYSTATKIEELLAKGYTVIEDGFPSDAVFDDDNAQDQVYVVKLGHATAPVGPNDPHEPGTPINPNDPNGPKWPSTDEYSKEYTSTVHFVDENGNKLRDDNVQSSTWTRTLIIDKVTGEVLNADEPWKADKASYDQVKVPVITGYVADKAVVAGQATQQQDLEATVTYKKIGMIVPVDPAGNPIPGAQTPQYKNDPNDPTKVIVTATPDVPGYSTDTPSVDPADPTANTQVVYKKIVTPAEPATPAKPTPNAQPEAQRPVVKPTATKTQPKDTPAKNAPELPQTGDSENNALAALGATMVASLLGLVGLKKRKKDEQDI